MLSYDRAHGPPSAWISQKLSRVTSSGEFISEVDGLRFIAISSVLLHHLMAAYLTTSERLGPVQLPADWYQNLGKSDLVRIAFCGYFGVHLFFVISGFVLALPFARAQREGTVGPSLKAYYWRRVRRIEPPYLLNLTLCFVLIVFTLSGWRAFVPHYFASLVYSHGLVYGEASWINGLAWSLEIEIQFYLLVPVLVCIFRVRHRMFRRVLLVALMVGLSLLSQTVIDAMRAPRLSLSLPNHLHYFVAGFLLVDLYLDEKERGRAKSFVWDIVAVIAGVLIVTILSQRPGGRFLLPALVVVLYASIFLGRASHWLITLRPIVILGGMCYTIYLYHFLIINWVQPVTARLSTSSLPLKIDFLIQCLLIVPVVGAVCAILFVLTERPFMTSRPARDYKRVAAPMPGD